MYCTLYSNSILDEIFIHGLETLRPASGYAKHASYTHIFVSTMASDHSTQLSLKSLKLFTVIFERTCTVVNVKQINLITS